MAQPSPPPLPTPPPIYALQPPFSHGRARTPSPPIDLNKMTPTEREEYRKVWKQIENHQEGEDKLKELIVR